MSALHEPRKKRSYDIKGVRMARNTERNSKPCIADHNILDVPSNARRAGGGGGSRKWVSGDEAARGSGRGRAFIGAGGRGLGAERAGVCGRRPGVSGGGRLRLGARVVGVLWQTGAGAMQRRRDSKGEAPEGARPFSWNLSRYFSRSISRFGVFFLYCLMTKIVGIHHFFLKCLT